MEIWTFRNGDLNISQWRFEHFVMEIWALRKEVVMAHSFLYVPFIMGNPSQQVSWSSDEKDFTLRNVGFPYIL